MARRRTVERFGLVGEGVSLRIWHWQRRTLHQVEHHHRLRTVLWGRGAALGAEESERVRGGVGWLPVTGNIDCTEALGPAWVGQV